MTPFERALGPGWLHLERPLTWTTVLLHQDTGAWVETSTAGLHELSTWNVAEIVAALRTVTLGGRHELCVTKDGGRVSWSVVRISPQRSEDRTRSVSLSDPFQARSEPGNTERAT